MKLIVYNGSPRKEKSSTKILLDHFLAGFVSVEGNSFETFYLRSVNNRDQQVKMFKEANHVLIGFPLYADFMPSFVKEFFESLEPICGKLHNLSLGFFVQSGFPEANHSRPVERYLEKLARRLGGKYIGTIIRGNANRIDEHPRYRNKPVFKYLFNLGLHFGQTGEFDPYYLFRLAKPEKIRGLVLFITRLMIQTRLATRNWDKKLRANGAFEKRFDTPFSKP